MGSVFKSLGITFLLIAFGGLVAFAGSPVPDTGQTTCWDSNGNVISCEGTGQDGEFSINPHSYTKLGYAGQELDDSAQEWLMVRDNITGLIWEVKTDDQLIHDKDNTWDWFDATEVFIATLNTEQFGGYSDWRVPTIKELSYLVDAERFNPAVNPAIDPTYFPNTASYRYWSSSSYEASPVSAWYVNFNYPIVDDELKANNAHVRAVRGVIRSNSFYVDNGDGTVTDTVTGLMWQQATPGTDYIWQGALDYCNDINLTLAGHTDWRLPNRNELQSLVDYTRYNPAIYETYFPGTSGWYWSSSLAWRVNIYYGYVYYDDLANNNLVRAVRAGQCRSLGHLIISNPVQGDIWDVGDIMPIIWKTQAIGGNVEISLSRSGGKTDTFSTIVGSTPNDGSYNWTVSGPFSANCVLKIVPLSAPSMETSQGLFTIAETVAAAVISGAPAAYTNQSDTVLQVGGDTVINYRYRIDGGAYSNPAHISESIGLFGLADGPTTVDVIGMDVRGDWQATPTTVSWTVDTVPPSTGDIVIANTSGKTSDPTPAISIASTGADLMRLALSSSELAAASWMPYATTYSGIDISAGGNGIKEVHAQFKDLAGNTTTGIYDSVYYENILPSVIVSANTVIVDEPAGTNEFTVHLNTQPSAQVTVSLHRENQQCTITPSMTFTPQDWQSPQTVTVKADDDGLIDGTQKCTIQISADSMDPNYQLPNARTVTVYVNDQPSAGIQILSLYPTLAKTGETTTFTVRGAGFGTPLNPRVTGVSIILEYVGTKTDANELTVFKDNLLRFTLQAPETEGLYRLVIQVGDGVSEEMPQALTLRQSLPSYKAVIVLGKAGPNAPIWESSRNTAHQAYQTLLESGFFKENIYYLSAEGNTDLDGNDELDDWDGPADLLNVKKAIDRCAAGEPTEQFVLYMIGDGYKYHFRLNESELLNADTLEEWLNNDLSASVLKEMIILYDACYSGSFIPPLMGLPNRVIITSSDGDSLSYIKEGHSYSFSTLFWHKIRVREKVGDAFEYAEGLMPDQTPQIDHDYTEVNPYALLIGRGGPPMSDTPIVTSAPTTRAFDNTTDIVEIGPVIDSQGIGRIFATVRTPCNRNREIDFTVQETAGYYEAIIHHLIFDGKYDITIFAEDSTGKLRESNVTKAITKTSPVNCHEPDLTLDGIIDLKDAILGLKILTGSSYREGEEEKYEKLDIDVDGNAKAGLEEVLFILRSVGNL